MRRLASLRKNFWRNKNEKTFQSNLFINLFNLVRRCELAGANDRRERKENSYRFIDGQSRERRRRNGRGAIRHGSSKFARRVFEKPGSRTLPLEAKLSSAIEAEVKEKKIDYLISAVVSHKKGGGGFGMFGKLAPVLGQVAPMAGMGGSVAGQIAGSVATTAIYTAATMSQNVKAKDSIELNVSMQKTGDKSVVLTKQFKGKAKSNGEDIITPMIEQSAQAILDAATGKTQTATTEKK
jgi:hypothetical protein